MAQPVWTLSVDLQTRTAVFQSGMSDAARAARGSFEEIKKGAAEMGRETSGYMTEARHGVMLLGEEFGIHLPRGITSFLASLGPVAAAMEAAFPFLAIIVGATLLLEHLAKMREAGEKLTESQVNFGTTVANVLNGLNEKLLQAGIRTDELNHNHLGALNKQLELIDHQSMNELVHAFDTVAKAADLTFTQLKTNWYSFGTGSAGAKHALDEFKTQYDSLLAQGKNQEAADLLAGTRHSAERVLELQKQAAANQSTTGTHGSHMGDYAKYEAAVLELKKQGTGFTQKEVEAQTTLVDALRAQEEVQGKVNALKQAEQSNARQTTGDKLAGDSDTAAKQQAQSQQKAAEEAQKLWEENYRRAVSALQENEREKIDATKQGSAARLAAIDAAIKEENAKGLQETGFYRSLLTDRVNTARQMADEEAKIKAEAAKEIAGHDTRMAELQAAADREAAQMKMAAGRMSGQEYLNMELGFAAQEYEAKKAALQKELAALDQHGKDYENKKRELNNRLLELDRQFQNQDQQLEDQARQKELSSLQGGLSRMRDAYAQSFTQVIMGKESLGKVMQQLDSQMASAALKNMLESLAQKKGVDGETRLSDARTAAADAFKWAGNPILGSALAAGAFAAVMAFAEGGIVPGVGIGDTVPAMLTPGEAVIPKRMTEDLQHAAKFGGDSDRPHVHVHHSPTYHISAIDGASVRGMLRQHRDEFSQHFHSELRRLNK